MTYVSKKKDPRQYIADHPKYYKNPGLISKIKEINASGYNVFHTVFGTEDFKSDLDEFMSNKRNNDLSTRSIWNVNLLLSSIYHDYIPNIQLHFGCLDEDISTLHDNVTSYTDDILGNYQSSDFLFDVPIEVCGRLTNEEYWELVENNPKKKILTIYACQYAVDMICIIM